MASRHAASGPVCSSGSPPEPIHSNPDSMIRRIATLTAAQLVLACAHSAPPSVEPMVNPAPMVDAGPLLDGPERPLRDFLLDRLNHLFPQGPAALERRPWEITLPEGPAWDRVRVELSEKLRARDVEPADTTYRVLRVSLRPDRPDTVSVGYGIDGVLRCRGRDRPAGGGEFGTIHTRRTPSGNWSPAWTGPIGRGDREPCPRAP